MSDETTVAPGLTDEEKATELENRIKSFNDELIPLLGKYELGLGATAFVNPNGTIGARPIVFEARKQAEEAETTPAPEAPAEAAPTATAA